MIHTLQLGQLGLTKLIAAATAAAVTWNPADAGANIVLSSGNTVAGRTAGGAVHQMVRSTSPKNDADGRKLYWELFHLTNSATESAIGGLVSATATLNQLLGQAGAGGVGVQPLHSSGNGFIFYNTGAFTNLGVFTDTTPVTRGAYNTANGFLWLGTKNAAIPGDFASVSDVENDLNPLLVMPATDLHCIAASMNNAAQSIGINCGQFPWGFSVPAGFVAWD